MSIFLVAAGGALGGIARYSIGKAISGKRKSDISPGTFAINITGAFLLGIANGLKLDDGLKLFLCVGFLGAFTTFSTFMYEGFKLFGENKKSNAITYLLITLALGTIGYITGYLLAGFLSKA